MSKITGPKSAKVLPGAQFVTLLADHCRQTTDQLLNGGGVLVLTTSWLAYLNNHFPACDPGYSFTPAADAACHTAQGEALAFLFELFQMLPAIKLSRSPGAQGPGSGGSAAAYNLTVFRSLTTLHLQRIDVHELRGIQELRPRLKRLTCRRGLATLKSLFSECGGDKVQVERPWSCLTEVDCSANSLQALEPTLRLLPHLTRLDLSDNDIPALTEDLAGLHEVTSLNLSFNHIESLEPLGGPELAAAAANLTHLYVASNNLRSIQGASSLVSLRCLDVSSNCISEVGDFERLAGLRHLSELFVEGNPVAYAQNGRARILALFRERAFRVALDGETCTDPLEHILVGQYRDQLAADELAAAAAAAAVAAPHMGIVPVSATTSPAESVVAPLPAASAPTPVPGRPLPVDASREARGSVPLSTSVSSAHASPKSGRRRRKSAVILDSPADRGATTPPVGGGPGSTQSSPKSARRKSSKREGKSRRSRIKSNSDPAIAAEPGTAAAAVVTGEAAGDVFRGAVKAVQRMQRVTKAMSPKRKRKAKSKAIDGAAANEDRLADLEAEQAKMQQQLGKMWDVGGRNTLAIYQAFVEHLPVDNGAAPAPAEDGEGGQRTGPQGAAADEGAGFPLQFSTDDVVNESCTDVSAMSDTGGPGPMHMVTSTPRRHSMAPLTEEAQSKAGGLDDSLYVSAEEEPSGDVSPSDGPLPAPPSSAGRQLFGEAGATGTATAVDGIDGVDGLDGIDGVTPLGDSSFDAGGAVPREEEGAGAPPRAPADAAGLPVAPAELAEVETTEEFFVDIFDRTNQRTSRIIQIHGQSAIYVLDAATAKTVDLFDLLCLTAVAREDGDDPPVVRLSFAYSRQDTTVVRCAMDSTEDAMKLEGILLPLASMSDGLNQSLDAQTRCLQCDNVFGPHDTKGGLAGTPSRACPRCGSGQVVDFYVSTLPVQAAAAGGDAAGDRDAAPSQTASRRGSQHALVLDEPVGSGPGADAAEPADAPATAGVAATAPLSAAGADLPGDTAQGLQTEDGGVKGVHPGVHPEDLAASRRDCGAIDDNTQLLLSLDHFEDGETAIGMMEAFVIHKEGVASSKEGVASSKEGVASRGFNARLVASSQRLVVLGKATEVYETYAAHAWSEFSGVQLGMGGQTFRLACSSATYEVRSGNEFVNDGFIGILSSIPCLAKAKLIRTDVKLLEAYVVAVNELEFEFESEKILTRLQNWKPEVPTSSVLPSLDVDCQAYFITRLAAEEAPEPRLVSLLITSTSLYLCREQHGWVDGVSRSPVVTVLAQRDVIAVSGLSYDRERKGELKIQFWEEGNESGDLDGSLLTNCWDLEFSAAHSIAALAERLDQLWQPNFGVPLPWV